MSTEVNNWSRVVYQYRCHIDSSERSNIFNRKDIGESSDIMDKSDSSDSNKSCGSNPDCYSYDLLKTTGLIVVSLGTVVAVVKEVTVVIRVS